MFCMSRRSKLAEALAETCRGVGGGRGGRRAPCAYNGGGGSPKVYSCTFQIQYLKYMWGGRISGRDLYV